MTNLYVDKQFIIDSYTMQLKEATHKYEEDTTETQEKLNMAFEIVGSLKKLLEQKEDYVEQLKIAKEQADSRSKTCVILAFAKY